MSGALFCVTFVLAEAAKMAHRLSFCVTEGGGLEYFS